ncbi:MAG: CDP-diacylglycerol--glycerol-3-phosphate 3-phosphatidyltransferase [Anaeroplasmataceae bacterium]|nr:CDP-diacylglycerol--glycerol-3-phosphate 3-phosphatidyltransferase [Anaeroplasmataceae bacterium]MDE6414953.1 CDP-diacylglycerol--glycerol-3-phosphate 3-phosphatidyltransferase [Anaeroplasmataceae bacterium]
MNLPNKLTMGRILAIPIMVVIAYIPYLKNPFFLEVSYANFINFILFALASFTDFLDGYIARKKNLVTTFGKFADPLADKILVMVTFLLLCMQGKMVTIGNVKLELIPVWGLSIIVFREFTVSGVRLVAAQKGEVIAAGWSGKVKTFETMIAICVLFFSGIHAAVAIIGLVLMYISVTLTLYSGIEYLWKNRKIIFESI